MLAVVLKRSYDYALNQIEQTFRFADAYEFRLDTFKTLDLNEIRRLMKIGKKPSIFSLRKENQGGWFSNDDQKRMDTLLPFLELSPEYIDLEYNTPIEHFYFIKNMFPKIKIMISYHDFISSSVDLNKLADRVFKQEADVYKLVTTAQTIFDSLNMLKLTMEYKKKGKGFIGVCMGDQGYLTRLLGPIVGNYFDFAASTEEGRSAPGQFTAQELCETYQYKHLNQDSKIYALIGHPVEQSISHVSHNRAFQECQINAIYIKIDLEESEVEKFLDKIQGLPFEGLSVTIPYKEKVFNWLNDFDQKARNIGASNTLVKVGDHFKGYNTDSLGALEAIEEVTGVKGKRIIILGAGGTAKAIAYEALRRGAKVSLINRTRERAINLSKKFHCEAFGFNEIDQALANGYDILINTTLIGMVPNEKQSPLAQMAILPGAVVMDVVTKPQRTKLLEDARAKECQVIYGYKMFVYQGSEQMRLWFGKSFDVTKAKAIIEESYQELNASP